MDSRRGTSHRPPLRLLFDGRCGRCARHADSLRILDRGRGRIELIDASDPCFDPAVLGLTRGQVLGSIHAILPTGHVVAGMEALRCAYRQLGRGWLLAPTAWPILRPLFDRAYAWFARHRTRCPIGP